MGSSSHIQQASPPERARSNLSRAAASASALGRIRRAPCEAYSEVTPVAPPDVTLPRGGRQYVRALCGLRWISAAIAAKLETDAYVLALLRCEEATGRGCAHTPAADHVILWRQREKAETARPAVMAAAQDRRRMTRKAKPHGSRGGNAMQARARTTPKEKTLASPCVPDTAAVPAP